MHFETLESRTLLSADPLGLTQLLIPANFEAQSAISAALEHASSIASEMRGGDGQSGSKDVLPLVWIVPGADARSDHARAGGFDRSDGGKHTISYADLGLKEQSGLFGALPDAVAERYDSVEDRLQSLLPASVTARDPSALVPSTSTPSGVTFSLKTVPFDEAASLPHVTIGRANHDGAANGAIEATVLSVDSKPAAVSTALVEDTMLLGGIMPTRADIGSDDTRMGAATQDGGSPSPASQINARAIGPVPEAAAPTGLLPAAATVPGGVTTTLAPPVARHSHTSSANDRLVAAGQENTDEWPSHADASARSDDLFIALTAPGRIVGQEVGGSKLNFEFEDLGYPQPLLTEEQASDASLHAFVAISAGVSIAATLHTNDRRRRAIRTDKDKTCR